MSVGRRLGAVLRLSSGLLVILALAWIASAVATGPANHHLLSARAAHTATAQVDGSLVIAGGTGNRGVLRSLEFFDPVSGKSTQGPRLSEARSGHSAIALADGRVLLTGGRGGDNALLASSEIYDAAASTLNPGASMGHARANHTSTLLADGRVLLAGGDAEGVAEIYDPATDRFVDAGKLAVARSSHSAVRLGDGRVLLVGGSDAAGATAEIFDPKTNTFSAVRGGLKTARVQPALKLISDGKVQVYGGDAEITMEVYNPVGYFSSRGHLLRDSSAFRSIMYSPGQAALISIPSAKSKHYAEDALGPAAGEFERTAHTATEVAAHSTMVVVGGFGTTGAALDTITELGSCGGTVTTDLTDYYPGQTVVMSGSGWTPGEQITLNLHRDTNDPPDTALYATADENGDWINSDYVVQQYDLNVTFVLTASGDTGCTAQTTFTDAAADTLHVRASAGVSFTLSYVNTNGGGACGSGSTATINVTSSLGLDDSEFGNSEKYQLTAPATLATPDIPAGATFDHWLLPDSTTSSTNPLCVNGSNGGKDRTYTAVYASTCTAPTVSANPANVTITYGANATFTATLTGSGSFTTQWQVDTGSGFSDIAGSAETSTSLTRTLTLTQPPVSDSGKHYRLRVVNPCGGADIFSNSALLTVNKADATISVSPYHVTYDATEHVVTGTATGVGGVDLAADFDFTNTKHTNAGTYASDTWSFHDSTGNYKDAGATITDIIDQATATITVNPYHVTYDATEHTATGTATGVGGVNLAADFNFTNTKHTNAGTYATDTWSFHDSTGNYKDAGATITDIIDQATATITVNPYHVTYDATEHTATGTATGVGGVNLAADFDFTNTKHTNAGTYASDTWSFHDSTGNYKDAGATITDIIDQATATITVNPYHVTYDATEHTATGTATGVGGVNLAADFNFTNTKHTNAGTYATDTWSFHDSTGNYKDAGATITDIIDQATATITVNPYHVTYDATEHTATGTATGVGGVNLAADFNFTNTKHTNAGTYATDTWSFHDSTGNYKDAGATITDIIDQATATITVNPYHVTYDATEHTATGTATGVGGVNLAADFDFTNTKHTNAGTYASDTWSFHDSTGNYKDAGATITDIIDQATATITVNPYHVTYDATEHTATGTATGVGGVNLAADFNFTNTKHTNAGTYATDTWSFHDSTGNYKDAGATITDIIDQATATITVNPYHVTYDATEHTATGTATGVGGVNLAADFNFTNTKHTNAGTYASDTWSFHDSAGNYKDAGATITDIIDQATATITVNPYHVTYDATEHTASGTATGVGGVNLAADFNFTNTKHTNAGTYASDTWSFHDSAGNYKDAGATITDIIDQATATITVNPYHVTYDATEHTATGTATGVGGVNLAADFNFTNTKHTNAGTYASDTWSFHDLAGNYKDAGATITDIIDKANATIVVTPYNVIYDTLPHTAAGSATGVMLEALAGLNLSGTTHTNAGIYTDTWTFTDVTGNYKNASGQVTDIIGARDALVRYIGQQTFVTSGSSSTTAQVTLSASVQDPTGVALVGAKVDFIDTSTGQVMAGGVPVSPVANSPANTGTANKIVTLSTGQFGAQSYLILVRMTGNYDNTDQVMADKTAGVVVMKPAVANTTTGGGTYAALGTAAGTYAGGGSGTPSFSVGMSYNKSFTNPKGQIIVTVPQAGGVVYIKSNSISSMAVSGKNSTIYTKSTLYEVLNNGTTVAIDGGVSLRLDTVDGSPDQVGVSVLSSSSVLYYSNNWTLFNNAWRTSPEALSTGNVDVN